MSLNASFCFFLNLNIHTHSHSASAYRMSRIHGNQQRNLSLLELHSPTPSSHHTRYPGSQSNRVQAFSLKTHCSEGGAKHVLLFYTVVETSTFSLVNTCCPYCSGYGKELCFFLNTHGLSLKVSNSRFKLGLTFFKNS